MSEVEYRVWTNPDGPKFTILAIGTKNIFLSRRVGPALNVLIAELEAGKSPSSLSEGSDVVIPCSVVDEVKFWEGRILDEKVYNRTVEIYYQGRKTKEFVIPGGEKETREIVKHLGSVLPRSHQLKQVPTTGIFDSFFGPFLFAAFFGILWWLCLSAASDPNEYYEGEVSFRHRGMKALVGSIADTFGYEVVFWGGVLLFCGLAGWGFWDLLNRGKMRVFKRR